MSREASAGARAAWGTISRKQVVDAAMRAIRQPGGYDQMTIRSLAADLGVAPMSLYRHVRDKDDLLDEVVDRLLVRAWKPRGGREDWKAWVLEAGEKLRHFLVSQPAALRVYLNHPVTSPAALARMEAMLEVLTSALGGEEAAHRAYAALQTYTVGFAALEASRNRHQAPANGARRPGVVRQQQKSPGQAGGPGVGLTAQLAAYTTPRQFAEGLCYLLDGIELGAARAPED